MEIMEVVSERLQANTDTIKQDIINWLTKLKKQLLEANGGHTEADLQRELSRKSKLLDAYLDGIRHFLCKFSGKILRIVFGDFCCSVFNSRYRKWLY